MFVALRMLCGFGPGPATPGFYHCSAPRKACLEVPEQLSRCSFGPGPASPALSLLPWVTLMEAASSTSSFGMAVSQPTPSQAMARRLIATGRTFRSGAVHNALSLMGIANHEHLPGRALVHVHEALLLAYVAAALSADYHSWLQGRRDDDDDTTERLLRDIIELDKDHQAPYTLRAWNPSADRPDTHLEVEATRAAALHEASIWMRCKPDALPLAAGERGTTAHTQPQQVLDSYPQAARERAVSQLRESLAYCESFSYQACHGCTEDQLVWPACRGEYCLGCLLSWFCEHP